MDPIIRHHDVYLAEKLHDHFSILDKIMLRRTCKRYKEQFDINKCFRDLLYRSLSRQGYTEINQIMASIDDQNGLITGDYLVHLIMNESVSYSSINIITPMVILGNLIKRIERMHRIIQWPDQVFHLPGINHVNACPLELIDKTYSTDILKIAYHNGKLFIKNPLKLVKRCDYIVPHIANTCLYHYEDKHEAEYQITK